MKKLILAAVAGYLFRKLGARTSTRRWAFPTSKK